MKELPKFERLLCRLIVASYFLGDFEASLARHKWLAWAKRNGLSHCVEITTASELIKRRFTAEDVRTCRKGFQESLEARKASVDRRRASEAGN